MTQNFSSPVQDFKAGVAYADGSAIQMDKIMAARWFRKAADRGLVLAQYHLGEFYASGNGVARDEVEAAKWSQEAEKSFLDTKRR